MKEALNKVKNDLGSNAVIFSSRSLRPAATPVGLYNRDRVEVTAAVERTTDNNESSFRDKVLNSVRPFNRCIREDTAAATGDEMTSILNNRYGNTPPESAEIFSSPFLPAFNVLIKSGFNQQLAAYLIAENTCPDKNIAPDKINAYLLKKIITKVPVDGQIKINNNNNKTKIIALIGPTGVGKTTTLAKIAAHFSIKEKLNVKIITIDTFRIAAAEQLKIYGKILGLNVQVTREKELAHELANSQNADLVLIDTPGRNYIKTAEVDRINTWISANRNIETHLLVSATTSKEALLSVVQSFNRTRIDRLLITKSDEALKFGHLYNVILTAAAPLSYITTGQNVPEDIIPATRKSVTEMFFSGKCN